MTQWKRKEMNKVAAPSFVTVYYASHEWTAPDNPDLKRWSLIVGIGDRLEWAHTYNPALAELGTHAVEFYKDTSMRNCIRKPKGASKNEAV